MIGITVDMVELVPASDIRTGDVLVSFTAAGRDVSIPPTQRQLNAARTRWFTVPSVNLTDRPNVIDFGTGDDRVTTMTSALVWRVTR